MLPTNCWREASRRHLLGLGKRLGGQSQQSDFHMLKLLFVQARPNCLGLAWRGGKPWQPKPWLFVRAAKSPSRCGAGQSLWTARPASALRSCLGQQRTRFRSRDGLPCASRDTRPSHLIQAPATFFPGQDAGSQLSARAESPARGREHREPPSSWPKERQRPGTLQGPGGRQRALGAWLEQGWSCPGGGGTPLNPTGPWGGGHRCLGCTPSCPGHRTGWSRGSWARSGSQSHTGAVISSRFLLVVVLWWDRHGSYRCRESQASFSLSREAEPRDHH